MCLTTLDDTSFAALLLLVGCGSAESVGLEDTTLSSALCSDLTIASVAANPSTGASYTTDGLVNNNAWFANANSYVTFDLGSAQSVSSVTLNWLKIGRLTWGSSNFNIKGSVDNVNWTTLASNLSNPNNGSFQTQTTHAFTEGSYRFIKVTYVSAVVGGFGAPTQASCVEARIQDCD